MCAIFLKHDDEFVEMVEQAYEAESVLQKLLADHPTLLAGDGDSEPRRRWLLVKRELGIASQEDGSDRWSIDHLFLDQDGVPTLVEVKRASDTRIRREVVGQLLDYAANASVSWGLSKIQAAFEGRHNSPEDAQVSLESLVPGSSKSLDRRRLISTVSPMPHDLQASAPIAPSANLPTFQSAADVAEAMKIMADV